MPRSWPSERGRGSTTAALVDPAAARQAQPPAKTRCAALRRGHGGRPRSAAHSLHVEHLVHATAGPAHWHTAVSVSQAQRTATACAPCNGPLELSAGETPQRIRCQLKCAARRLMHGARRDAVRGLLKRARQLCGAEQCRLALAGVTRVSACQQGRSYDRQKSGQVARVARQAAVGQQWAGAGTAKHDAVKGKGGDVFVDMQHTLAAVAPGTCEQTCLCMASKALWRTRVSSGNRPPWAGCQPIPSGGSNPAESGRVGMRMSSATSARSRATCKVRSPAWYTGSMQPERRRHGVSGARLCEAGLQEAHLHAKGQQLPTRLAR